MGAPAGNKFWLKRSKHGRDRIFTDPQVLWEAACEYFEYTQKNPLYAVEQRKGNVNIKAGEDSTLTKKEIRELSNPLQKVPRMVPFTMHGLTLFLDVYTQYFNEFEQRLNADKMQTEDPARKRLAEDFTVVVSRIKEIIYQQKFAGAAAGFFQQNIIARDLGISDKKEITGAGGQPFNPVPTINVNTYTGQAPIKDNYEEEAG